MEEPVLVQTFVAELAIEAFDVAVLPTRAPGSELSGSISSASRVKPSIRFNVLVRRALLQQIDCTAPARGTLKANSKYANE
jgi:hypothetical protein